MKLGVMQPYFFPYIGYFDLIHQTDRWIVFDTAQYIRHGWVNRNRIIHPRQGWQYIGVPVQRHHRETPIKDIQIAEDGRWRDRLVGQLQHYKKRAPFFTQVMDLVLACLQDREGSLSRLNASSLARVCAYLDIPFDHDFFSEMDLQLGPVECPGDWALRIAEALGATEYINPPGGADLFESSKFEAAGIRLSIQPPVELVYGCRGYEFQPNLSILDVLMWNSPASVRAYLAARCVARESSR